MVFQERQGCELEIIQQDATLNCAKKRGNNVWFIFLCIFQIHAWQTASCQLPRHHSTPSLTQTEIIMKHMLHSNSAAAPPLCESPLRFMGVCTVGRGKGLGGGSQIRLVLSVRSIRQGFTHLSMLMSLRMSLMSSTDRQQSSAQQSLTNTSLAHSKFRGSRAYLFRSPKSLYCLRLATPEGIDLLQSSETFYSQSLIWPRCVSQSQKKVDTRQTLPW